MADRSITAQRTHVLATARNTQSASVCVRPLDSASRFSLRLRGVDVPPSSNVALPEEALPTDALRFELPINRCMESSGLTIARLGPDEWLVLGAEGGAPAQRLSETIADRTHSLVDIGHRQVAIEVSGLHAREVLNGGCPLDLGDEAFPPGSATRTILGKAEIILIRQDEALTYRVECWRSFAPYVYGLLAEIASEFG